MKRNWTIGIWFFIGLGFLCRWVNLFLFPHFLTEDSGGYLQAMRFLEEGLVHDRVAFGYRQLSYPLLLKLFSESFAHPLFTLMAVQTALSAFVPYFFYRICKVLDVSLGLTFIGVAFLAIYSRPMIYSAAVAPESLISFCIAVSFVLTAVILRDLQHGVGGLKLWLRFAALTLVLFFMVTLKEMFLLNAALAFSTIGGYLLTRRPFRVTEWLRPVCAVVAFSILFLLGLAWGRAELQTSRFRPTCFPWPLPLICYYVDFDSPQHAQWKSQVREQITANQKNLEVPAFSYDEGNFKVNGNCFSSNLATSLFTYSENQAGIAHDGIDDPSYETFCAAEKIGGEIVKEGLRAHFSHYLSHWVFHEIDRALFAAGHLSYGEHLLGYSKRDMNEAPWRERLRAEFSDPSLYRFFEPTSIEVNWRDVPGLGLSPLPPAIVLIFGWALFVFWKRRPLTLDRHAYQTLATLAAVTLLLSLGHFAGDPREYWRFLMGFRTLPQSELYLAVERALPHNYVAFSALLILTLPYFIWFRAWRMWTREQSWLVIFLASQFLVYLFLVSSVSWFYDRYTAYIYFSLVTLSVTLATASHRAWRARRAV